MGHFVELHIKLEIDLDKLTKNWELGTKIRLLENTDSIYLLENNVCKKFWEKTFVEKLISLYCLECY